MRHAARDAAVVGVAAALMFGSQVALSFLPNVELVSLLVILFAQHLGRRALFAIYVFVLLEGLLYGFGSWWLVYLYIWTVLYIAARLLRQMHAAVGWAIVSGIFGLLFGFLSSFVYLFLLGFWGGVTYFVQGIIFDLVHCAGNFVVALLLYRPLDAAMRMICVRLYPEGI
jgi:energy-coupling factor transport system substrate-specific component